MHAWVIFLVLLCHNLSLSLYQVSLLYRHTFSSEVTFDSTGLTAIWSARCVPWGLSVCVCFWILCVSDCIFVGERCERRSFLYYLYINSSVGHSRNVLRHSKCMQNMHEMSNYSCSLANNALVISILMWLSRRHPHFTSTAENHVEVNTVDRYQERDKDCIIIIIISYVRSNPNRKVSAYTIFCKIVGKMVVYHIYVAYTLARWTCLK